MARTPSGAPRTRRCSSGGAGGSAAPSRPAAVCRVLAVPGLCWDAAAVLPFSLWQRTLGTPSRQAPSGAAQAAWNRNVTSGVQPPRCDVRTKASPADGAQRKDGKRPEPQWLLSCRVRLCCRLRV